MSTCARAVLSLLVAMMLLGTSMGSVCEASCCMRAVGPGCHGMAGAGSAGTQHEMVGMAEMPAQPVLSGQHQIAPDCAGMSCSSLARTMLARVSWPEVQVPADAMWVRLPAKEDRVLRVAHRAARGVAYREQLLPPQLRSPLRV